MNCQNLYMELHAHWSLVSGTTPGQFSDAAAFVWDGARRTENGLLHLDWSAWLTATNPAHFAPTSFHLLRLVSEATDSSRASPAPAQLATAPPSI